MLDDVCSMVYQATYLDVDPFLLLKGLQLLHKSLLRHDD